MRTVSINARLVISHVMKRGIPFWFWQKVKKVKILESPFIKRRFWDVCKKGSSDFSHKKGVVSKIKGVEGGAFFKKGIVSLIFILKLSRVKFLKCLIWMCMCVYLCVRLFGLFCKVHIFISILQASQEERSLIELSKITH